MATKDADHRQRNVDATDFRQFFDCSPDAILIADPDTETIVDANPTACELLGRERHDIVGRHQSELHPPMPDELHTLQFRQHVEAALTTGRTSPLATAFLRPDGSTIPAEAIARAFTIDGQTMLVGFFRDLRERQRIEQQLAQATELSQRIIDTANVLIVGLNDQGAIVLFNRYAEELTGWSLADLSGRDWFATVCPRELYPDVRAEFERLLAKGPPGQFENPICTRTGDRRLIAWSNSVIEDPEADIRILSIGVDVTDQRAVEIQLRQADKMRAIGQLAGGIAHDFNNQLQIMSGFADLLLTKIEDPRQQRQVQAIIDSCSRSAELTAKLLAFSRKAAIRREPIDLHEVINEACVMLEHSIDKRITLESRLDAEDTGIIGDSGSLVSALLNLGVNARDAMPGNGDLVFSTANENVTADQFKHTDFAIEPGPYCRITVSDTGGGIDPGTLKRIFEPFFTTKPVGQGTGLGLAAVYGTMQEHDGAVTVDSTIGQGTQFHLWLPIDTRSAPVPEPDSQATATRRHLLVVDDDELVREIIVEDLQELGHQATAFSDGSTAVVWCEEHISAIDLAIVDLTMPGMSGLELIRLLHARQPKLPVIVGTGLSQDEVDSYVREHPLISILCKPFRFATFADHLSTRLSPA